MKQENNLTENEITDKKDRDDHKTRGEEILQEILLWCLTVAVAAVSAFFYQKQPEEIAAIAILSGMFAGALVFALETSRMSQTFLYDNGRNLWRFMLVYCLFLAASVCCPLFPESGWPFLTVFVALMLFGNELTGMIAGCGLVLISMLLQENADPVIFFIYMMIGMIGVLLFSILDERFKIWLPMLTSLLLQFVCLCVYTILYQKEKFDFQMLLIPAVNTVVTLILLLVLLKFFSFSLNKTRDIYMNMNDPECALLVKLKDVSKEDYYHTIHTAYFCSRIALKLGLDENVVKACGYYHRIGMLRGEKNWENTERILKRNQFPDRISELLKQYLDPAEQIVAKELVVLLFSDTVISSIQYLFSKDKTITLDYQKLIQAIFKRQLESGMLDHSEISLREIQVMKKIFIEEGLYYDFLR